MRTVTKHDGPCNDLNVADKIRVVADLIEQNGWVSVVAFDVSCDPDVPACNHQASIKLEWRGPLGFVDSIRGHWFTKKDSDA